MIPHYPFNRKKGQKPFCGFRQAEIRGIEDEVTGAVVCSKFCGKTTSEATTIYDQVVFAKPGRKCFVYELHIHQQGFFASFAGAFPKAPVVYQHHIIPITGEIGSILGPTFDASCVAVEVKNQTFRLVYKKMQAADEDPGFGLKTDFGKWRLITKPEIGRQLFGFKYEFFLDEISNNR